MINETVLVIRGKGGRSKGSTATKKRDFYTAMVVARNEVAASYDKEKRQHGRDKKIMKKDVSIRSSNLSRNSVTY